MKTTESTFTTGLTPVEAANLLATLQQGQEAAWRSAAETRRESPEYESRSQNAADVDSVFRDVMRETAENDMRRPGEPVEQFAERAESEARLADARRAEPEPVADAVTGPATHSAPSERSAVRQNEIVARQLNDPATPEGEAYAKALSNTAATHARQLRERGSLAEPDRRAGAAHPDPFLAARGLRADDHGVYSPKPEPQAAPRIDKDLEAG